MACMEKFTRCIASLKLPATSPVAIAVSGGGDSIALTYLARQLFKRVVGITVDHQLRKESREEAEKTRQLVANLGAEHHILTLDWEEKPPNPGKVQAQARVKRYNALFQFCQQLGINVVMFGHHFDDQLETFIYRLSRGSGIDGLACMRPVISFRDHPDMKIVRPLLHCTKESLIALCQERGLEWVEDPTNDTHIYVRNVIRKRILAQNPELHSGLGELIQTCGDARSAVSLKVVKAVQTIPEINQVYGYVTVPVPRIQQLSPPVAMRTLYAILRYTGTTQDVHFSQVQRVYKLFRDNPENAKVFSASKCTILQVNRNLVAITRQLPHKIHRTLTPIQVGQTIHWDRRFDISLGLLGGQNGGEKRKRQSAKSRQANEQSAAGQFYVRHMLQKDWELARKGIRKVRTYVLPPEHVRGSLPVILDENMKVVLIPHFKVIDRSAGVTCKVKFAPRHTIEDYIHYFGPQSYRNDQMIHNN